MYFHTFIDAKGDWLDAVCFPQIAISYPVTGKRFYSMKGKVVEEFGVYIVDVSYCRRLGLRKGGRKGNKLVKDKKPFADTGGKLPAIIFW